MLNPDVYIALVIVFFIVVIITVFCVRAMKKDKKQEQKILDEHNAIKRDLVYHHSGLSISEGARCTIYLCNDKFIFEHETETINLSFDKITGVEKVENTEMSSERYSYLFVFTYSSDNETKTLKFYLPASNYAGFMILWFNDRKKQPAKVIDL
ncbi:MAG: hypothetical protein BGN88_02240 [Clostridiales bacterium 43-6]|nr:MAG: hypothetical protein BGN88_02240 [Clostridiales bacterium 43-6]